MAEINITKENYEKEVLQSDKPVLLDFWATWCGPCLMLSPTIEKIAEKYDGQIKIGKVNVDEESDLANAFHVQSIPMLFLMKDGKIANSTIGYQSMEKIEALLK